MHLLVDLNAHSALGDVPDDACSAVVHLVWHTLHRRARACSLSCNLLAMQVPLMTTEPSKHAC